MYKNMIKWPFYFSTFQHSGKVAMEIFHFSGKYPGKFSVNYSKASASLLLRRAGGLRQVDDKPRSSESPSLPASLRQYIISQYRIGIRFASLKRASTIYVGARASLC